MAAKGKGDAMSQALSSAHIPQVLVRSTLLTEPISKVQNLHLCPPPFLLLPFLPFLPGLNSPIITPTSRETAP